MLCSMNASKVWCFHISDASYTDPIGEAPARPKTAGGAGRRAVEIDDFEDDDIGDDLLPD